MEAPIPSTNKSCREICSVGQSKYLLELSSFSALPCSVVRMVLTAFIIFILHKVEISEDRRSNIIVVLSTLCVSMSSPVQAVEGILEEESQKTVCPSVGPEEVQHPQPGAAEADPGEELELEGCLAVELALDVVLEHELGQLGELAALGVDVPEQDEEVHCDPSPVRGVVYVTLRTSH